jgi:hypothetical protein
VATIGWAIDKTIFDIAAILKTGYHPFKQVIEVAVSAGPPTGMRESAIPP